MADLELQDKDGVLWVVRDHLTGNGLREVVGEISPNPYGPPPDGLSPDEQHQLHELLVRRKWGLKILPMAVRALTSLCPAVQQHGGALLETRHCGRLSMTSSELERALTGLLSTRHLPIQRLSRFPASATQRGRAEILPAMDRQFRLAEKRLLWFARFVQENPAAIGDDLLLALSSTLGGLRQDLKRLSRMRPERDDEE